MTRSPVIINSMALAAPTRRTRVSKPPQSGISPIFTKLSENSVFSQPRRMSQARAIFMPPPAAGPLTPAITGCGMARSRLTTCSTVARWLSRTEVSLFSCHLAIASISPPAQNARPAPVITIQRTFGSVSNPRSPSSRTSRMLPARAFMAPGLFKVMVATRPVTSNRTWFAVISIS